DREQSAEVGGGAPGNAHAIPDVHRGNALGEAGRSLLITDFKALLRTFTEAGVEFIVIEGVAAGSPHPGADPVSPLSTRRPARTALPLGHGHGATWAELHLDVDLGDVGCAGGGRRRWRLRRTDTVHGDCPRLRRR